MSKWLHSFKYAWEGLRHAVRTERNMRFHVAAAVAAVLLGAYGRLDLNEWLWVALAVVLVISAECFNTAIERLTDLESSKQHPLAKAAKDTAAAGVLAAACFAAIVGILVLLPAVLARMTS